MTQQSRENYPLEVRQMIEQKAKVATKLLADSVGKKYQQYKKMVNQKKDNNDKSVEK